MENLFAYGTLMCADIMLEVSGCTSCHEPVTLQGYCRRSVKGEQYPAIMPAREGLINGVVYRNLPDSAWKRLDLFEGRMYARQTVRIELRDGTRLPAATYVVRPEFLDRLEQVDWDFALFLRRGKAGFQHHYQGYRALREGG